MAPKPIRRANPADSTAIPPPLPPSVEEAYRRKCLQLKRRTNEVQEDNDAARVRLHRLRRGVEKLRLERAFLLDQLAKRTSTNVEDSEGSPSPPPTVRDEALHESQSQNLRPSAHSPSPAPAPARSVTGLLPRPRPQSNHSINNKNDDKPASASASGIGNSGTGTDHDLPHRQPQEKPLRSKRGHRKPSVVASLDPNGPPATFVSQGSHNLSPSSDAFSHSVTAGEGASSSQQLKDLPEQRSNGVGSSSNSSSKPAKKPSTAFDLYARDNRDQASESKADGVTVEEELARGWKDLPEGQRDEYKAKEKAEADVEAEKEKAAASEKKEERQKVDREESERRRAGSQADADDTPARDEDEEMEVDD